MLYLLTIQMFPINWIVSLPMQNYYSTFWTIMPIILCYFIVSSFLLGADEHNRRRVLFSHHIAAGFPCVPEHLCSLGLGAEPQQAENLRIRKAEIGGFSYVFKHMHCLPIVSGIPDNQHFILIPLICMRL